MTAEHRPSRRPADALVGYIASRQRGEGPDRIRGIVIRSLYGDAPEGIDEVLVGDIADASVARALLTRSPPKAEESIPVWMARLVQRVIASHLRALAVARARFDGSCDLAEWPDPRPEPTDWGARAHLLAKWLDRALGDDARRRDTMRMMAKFRLEGWSLAEIAQESGTTPLALKMRFHKLRKELAPKVARMDRGSRRSSKP
jgi:DNA-directed RNA polymerase specialized sigma24 family protein